jgi:hypothetical protein
MTPAQIAEPRRGRPAAAETRLEQIEGESYEINHLGRVRYGHARQRRISYDLIHDRELRAGRLAARACPSCRLTVDPLLARAEQADALEDAAAEAGDAVVALMLEVGRRIAGWIEARTTGRGRGRAARRATVAMQGTLEMRADDGR